MKFLCHCLTEHTAESPQPPYEPIVHCMRCAAQIWIKRRIQGEQYVVQRPWTLLEALEYHMKTGSYHE